MMQDFGENDVYLSAFVVSSYVLGYAVGPLIVGPLSEIYGRVWLYHICNLLFVGFTCGCAASHSLRMLAVMRFFAGWGGSSVFTLGPASTADMVRPERRGPFLAVIGVMFNLGPAVSPVIGSYVNVWRNWRWVFILTAVMGAVGTLAGFAGLSETYAPILLEGKTRRLRSWTGNHALRSGLESGLSPWQTFRTAILRPLKMLLLPNILLASFLTATGYGFMYILYCTFPTTFTHVYHWQPKHIGYGYLGTAMGNVLGLGLGAGINGAICKKKAAKGDTKPENQIFLMMFMWPLVGVGLIMYGWTAQNGVHWMAPLVGSALFGAGAMSAVVSVSILSPFCWCWRLTNAQFFCGVYIVDAYTVHSASGMAASTVLRSLFGGVIPLFANKLYGNLGVGWSSTILGCIALLMAPVPYYFYRYGERLRASKAVPL
jgi:multidrug resistance protein